MRTQKITFFFETSNEEVNSFSLIYLSQNYAKGLKEKISFLLDELSYFENSELIVIDDASSDETFVLLQGFNNKKLRYVSKEKPLGIPDSMNLGVKLSIYQIIVFCDQRQIIDKGAIKKLIAPLKYNEIGIVSSCISSYDKMNKFNVLRAHENYSKKLEGQTGNLIGVYGPLYALKKECYHEIPDNIILDDLYLTLKILSNRKAVFNSNCKIIDDNFNLLYNYKRTKRYLAGYFQILNEKDLIAKLSKTQKVMLFWHKYFRVAMPLLFACCYVFLGLNSLYSYNIFLIFLGISIFCISVFLPINLKFFRQTRSIVSITCFYFVACFELFFRSFILNQNIYEK